jgi:2-amino-4-hydroxy-6-hydroxymethyldihydropteridine diphosphokinase
MKRVYLCLGSNLGDRLQNLHRAIGLLGPPGLEVHRVSSFYRTEPVEFTPQPWFVNCVVEASTELLPLRLLNACQVAERALGRRPGVAKGPRMIDIDILLYSEFVIRSPQLSVPHPRMGERRFMLAPLAELAPGIFHPVTGRSIQQMLSDLPNRGRVVKLWRVPTYSKDRLVISRYKEAPPTLGGLYERVQTLH